NDFYLFIRHMPIDKAEKAQLNSYTPIRYSSLTVGQKSEYLTTEFNQMEVGEVAHAVDEIYTDLFTLYYSSPTLLFELTEFDPHLMGRLSRYVDAEPYLIPDAISHLSDLSNQGRKLAEADAGGRRGRTPATLFGGKVTLTGVMWSQYYDSLPKSTFPILVDESSEHIKKAVECANRLKSGETTVQAELGHGVSKNVISDALELLGISSRQIMAYTRQAAAYGGFEIMTPFVVGRRAWKILRDAMRMRAAILGYNMAGVASDEHSPYSMKNAIAAFGSGLSMSMAVWRPDRTARVNLYQLARVTGYVSPEIAFFGGRDFASAKWDGNDTENIADLRGIYITYNG
ncbi:MAG: hypothetical protein JWL62_1416, partial [Hyphomicrobiales bacterium]|nr:hypothetical protein [Hyphomicrobiales bacterium]